MIGKVAGGLAACSLVVQSNRPLYTKTLPRPEAPHLGVRPRLFVIVTNVNYLFFYME